MGKSLYVDFSFCVELIKKYMSVEPTERINVDIFRF